MPPDRSESVECQHQGMDILIVTPSSVVRRTGNQCTASQYAAMLRDLGHAVAVGSRYNGEPCDLLFALHAERSWPAIEAYRREGSGGRVVVVATGTDIYPDLTLKGSRSMWEADRIVVLQDHAAGQVPGPLREKVRVIVQSARRLADRPEAEEAETFDLCVVGHFREVKMPLLTARAVTRLPGESRVRVRHAGGILDERFRVLVEEEQRENARWEWVGELDQSGTAQLLATSRLMVLTSRHEGGARVVGEAFVHGTPVLSSRIAGVAGLLGADYPGFFPVGDVEELARMIRRFEVDGEFRRDLEEARAGLVVRFEPASEMAALRKLIEELA